MRIGYIHAEDRHADAGCARTRGSRTRSPAAQSGPERAPALRRIGPVLLEVAGALWRPHSVARATRGGRGLEEAQRPPRARRWALARRASVDPTPVGSGTIRTRIT